MKELEHPAKAKRQDARRLHPFIPVLLLALTLGLGAQLAWWFYWPDGLTGLDVQTYPVGRDFINIWAGVRLALKGHVDQLYDLAAYHNWIGEAFGQKLPFHLWNYPPTFLLLIWPFALPPYFVGLALYQALSLAFFLWVALALLPAHQRVLGGLLIALAPASLFNLFTGQNGFLTGAMVLLAWRMLERRPALSGMLFGLLTFKPQLGLLVPPVLLMLRAWRVIAVAVAVALAMAGLSVLLFGFQVWQIFFTATRATTVMMLESVDGFFTYMYMSVFYGLRVSGASLSLACVLQGLVALLALGLTLWTLARTTDRERRLPVLISAATLITPYLFDYDLTALSAVAVWRLLDKGDKPSWVRACYAALWMSPFVTFYTNGFWIGLSPVFLVLAFVATLYEAHRPVESAHHS
jgi:hypothetical protein